VLRCNDDRRDKLGACGCSDVVKKGRSSPPVDDTDAEGTTPRRRSGLGQDDRLYGDSSCEGGTDKEVSSSTEDDLLPAIVAVSSGVEIMIGITVVPDDEIVDAVAEHPAACCV
jgi:hypothetical protein